MTLYLIMVVVLFFLAVTDLTVGVSNDAVNFLNSAKGARAAKNWIIMTIASLGVLLGATFSSGMMEVARKGIFHPESFVFAEIMIIYLAVMLTDVILLDAYNTLSLPTSTTVSIVFELMGAAVAVALFKIWRGDAVGNLSTFINSDTALAIISGILLSVIIAFSVGALVQFLTRLLFTFKYEKGLARYGAIWGGFCISIITYFILIKGAKGSSFMTDDLKHWIVAHTWQILGVSFAIWTVIIQLGRWLFKMNIPRFIILVGTFALAFAFAGNDLVNFIGVPLAGFKSYQGVAAHPGADPATFSMAFLAGKVKTETYLLLIAGLIMVITLWVSNKAKKVSKTELSIARQGDDGDERFDSNGLSRSVVRMGVGMAKFTKSITPRSVRNFVDNRFSRPAMHSDAEVQSFDMIRASMNLTVASILIALGTSLKLPLSTTYVTFMVSMGTSLADRAWGRESAVYRLSGVFTVIGGWFLTAIIAFTVSFIFAMLMSLLGVWVALVLFVFAAFSIYRTYASDKKEREEEELDHEEENDVFTACNKTVVENLDYIPALLSDTLSSIEGEKRHRLKALNKDSKELLLKTKNKKNTFTAQLRSITDESSLEYGHFYLQMLHYIREFSRSTDQVIVNAYEYIDNNHCAFNKEQTDELNDLISKTAELFSMTSDAVNDQDFSKKEEIKANQEQYMNDLAEVQKKQIRRIKNGEVSTRNSMLFLTFVSCIKDLMVDIIRLLKVQSKFTIPEKS